MLRLLFIVLLILAPAGAWSAQTGEVSAARPAEYMIYQYPGVPLVVKIDVPEVGFNSKIYGPEDALIMSSGIPSARIGPLYQYIPPSDIPRQLMIKVSSERKVDRSRISLELIQLPPGDRISAAFARAYQLFSSGTESMHGSDTTTWAMKAYTLSDAARAFRSLGWEEMRLWSEYYSAVLVLHKLNDPLMALELLQVIQESARTAGLGMVELAALILEGEALMRAGADASGGSAHARFEQSHAVWDHVVLLASQQGLRAEQARALYNDGLAYQQQDQLEAAVRRFQHALDLSLSADDPELVNEIRSIAATAYETQGSTSGAIEMLEDIGSDLESDAGQELTDNLYEKGRILNSSYRYPEASAELDQALRIQKSDAAHRPWGPTGLALAWSYYSMGDTGQAASLILESIPRTPQSSNKGALIRAYNSLARIYRDQGQYRQMSQYRQRQERLIEEDRLRTEFLFESGMDAWRRDGARSGQARELLTRSRQLAEAGDHALAGHRAALYLCLLGLEQKGRGACTAAGIRRSHDSLRKGGIPKLALDSDFVMAQILRREGKHREALALMDELIAQVLFFRQTLPGVLGAWYWQSKVDIFQEYMAITLTQSDTRAGAVDGRRVLLALDHIRLVEGADGGDREESISGSRQDEALRTLLNRREIANGTDAANLGRQANAELLRLRDGFDPAISTLDSASLDDLLAGLAQDESILSYYFTGSAGYALVGSRKGVSLVKLAGPEPLPGRLHRLREQLGRDTPTLLSEFDAMGRLLLEPVSGLLTTRIFLLPAGPLNGFPFDLLRLDGKFLAEKYRVVNLMNLAGAARSRPVLGQDYPEQVFLAGNPQSGQELFSYDMQVSTEITAVTDIFVGPGLHIVQGVALTKDEFQDARFAGGDLLHLAVPGAIDLAFPGRSRLLMSGIGDGSAIENLPPGDIQSLDFQAELVVLSRTSVVAASRSSFDNRLAFVSEFLDGGARHVIASLWSNGDSETAAFMREFYGELESSRDVSEALSRTRMRRMETSDDTNFKSWAGFQLFIR